MSAFLIAFLAAALATLGGREAVRVARLGVAMGRGGALAPAIVLSTAASSALAAWAGWRMGLWLSPAAQQIFIAAALVLAAAQTWLLRAGPGPREPTRSFAAIFLVLLLAMAGDAARVLIFAIALGWGQPWFTGSGAAVGSGAVLLLARAAGNEWDNRLPEQGLRHGMTALLLLACIPFIMFVPG